MQILTFEYHANLKTSKKAHVGYVGSGDLEILMQPNLSARTTIQVMTSVQGSEQRWQNVFERIFSVQQLPAVHIDIHDFGATPGVVRLRLEQAFEELACG